MSVIVPTRLGTKLGRMNDITMKYNIQFFTYHCGQRCSRYQGNPTGDGLPLNFCKESTYVLSTTKKVAETKIAGKYITNVTEM